MGLGRSFSVRALGVTAVALTAVLLAPPPTHNHIGERPALESHIAHPCTADGRTPHLHPARTTPAPDCPACAAGPAAVGTLIHPDAAAAPVIAVALPPRPDLVPAPWVPLHRAARAPPASHPAA
jgi:hypothetical protein